LLRVADLKLFTNFRNGRQMDERLKTIDGVIAENNKVSNKLNKKASEARQKMSLSDRKRRSDLRNANYHLERAKFLIVQTLTKDYEV